MAPSGLPRRSSAKKQKKTLTQPSPAKAGEGQKAAASPFRRRSLRCAREPRFAQPLTGGFQAKKRPDCKRPEADLFAAYLQPRFGVSIHPVNGAGSSTTAHPRQVVVGTDCDVPLDSGTGKELIRGIPASLRSSLEGWITRLIPFDDEREGRVLKATRRARRKRQGQNCPDRWRRPRGALDHRRSGVADWCSAKRAPTAANPQSQPFRHAEPSRHRAYPAAFASPFDNCSAPWSRAAGSAQLRVSASLLSGRSLATPPSRST